MRQSSCNIRALCTSGGSGRLDSDGGRIYNNERICLQSSGAIVLRHHASRYYVPMGGDRNTQHDDRADKQTHRNRKVGSVVIAACYFPSAAVAGDVRYADVLSHAPTRQTRTQPRDRLATCFCCCGCYITNTLQPLASHAGARRCVQLSGRFRDAHRNVRKEAAGRRCWPSWLATR